MLRSPFEHLTISRVLPGSSEALQHALALAERQSREFIAEAAVMNPVNNSKAATEFVHSYGSFKSEVVALITSADELDDRWSMLWTRKPE